MTFRALGKRIGGLADSDAPHNLWWFSIGFLVAVTIAELVTALVDPRWGLVLHAALLLGLPLWSAFRWRFPDHNLALAFTLVPLIRVLSLSLPLARFPIVTWYMLTAVPLTVSAYVVQRILALSRRDVGVRVGRWRQQLLVALPGFAFGFLEYWILRPQPLISELTLEAAWFPMLTLLVATGFAEEFVFRGVLQKVSMDVLGERGLLLVAIIFAVLHVGYLSVSDVVFVFCVGLYFAWATRKTGSILGATVAHGLTNILLFVIIPFLGVMSPAPPRANAQFPIALKPKNPVVTSAAPAGVTSTPTPAIDSQPFFTAVGPQETAIPIAPKLSQPQETATPVAPTLPQPQETLSSFTWSAAPPRLKAPWPLTRVFLSPVRLSWEWSGWLLEGLYFEVSLWSPDNLTTPVGTKLTTEAHCDFDFSPYPPGTYFWTVRVVAGHVDDSGQVVVDGPRSMESTKRSIRWGSQG